MGTAAEQKAADRFYRLLAVGRDQSRRKEMGLSRSEARKAKRLLPAMEEMLREATDTAGDQLLSEEAQRMNRRARSGPRR